MFEKIALSTAFQRILPPSGQQIIPELREGPRTFWDPGNVFGPQRPLATVRPPHAPRRRPPEPARSGRTRTLPRWLLPATYREFPKTERGPISTSEPSISLCAEPGGFCRQIHPFLPTRR